MRKLNQKQYAAFAANAKTLDSLRRNEVNYVPGVFEVTKVIVLGKEDFEKLSEDVSPEYPFLKDNRELMSADPGGLFRCLMVRTKGEQEYMRQTEFRVEQVVVLADEEYRQFQETGFLQDQIFLFDYQDKMWFDPGSLCWHCVLVKGETSRDGILVESEGYCYTRYAAFAPDCGKLCLLDIPDRYENPAKAPGQKKSRKRKVPER